MNAYHEATNSIDPKTIAYIDEMGIDTFIYRQYAYAKRGVKVAGRISGKKFKRTSIVAAKINGDIIAPLQYQGSMDSEPVLNNRDTGLARRLFARLGTDDAAYLQGTQGGSDDAWRKADRQDGVPRY